MPGDGINVPKGFALRDRVVERGRGCYSCISFDNGTLCKQKYAAHRAARVIELRDQELAAGDRIGPRQSIDLDILKLRPRIDNMMAQGFTEAESIKLIQKAEEAKANSGPTGGTHDPRFRLFDTLIASGEAGLCLIGKAPSDFVHSGYLCPSWNGRQGSSVATSGHAVDLLPDELRERVDEKAAKIEDEDK